MADDHAPSAQSGPPTEVPTAFGFKITLPASATKTITIKSDQDLLLDGIEAQSEGAALLRIRFDDAPPEGPTATVPAIPFDMYLRHELPIHLASLTGEEFPAWQARNQALRQAAQGGDDEAFFELLARDPRELASELTLRLVLTWRAWIERYTRVFRFKPSRLLAAHPAATEARNQMERARRNLARLGQAQLEPFDSRGKRLLPPGALVRGLYYGLLCLLKGLRTLYRERQRTGSSSRQLEAFLSAVVDCLATATAVNDRSLFLCWVQEAIRVVRAGDLLAQAGLGAGSLSDLVGPKDATPSDVARALTAAAFEVSADTVERLATQPVAVPLPSTKDEWVFLSGPLTYDLLEFPEVQPLLAQLTR